MDDAPRSQRPLFIPAVSRPGKPCARTVCRADGLWDSDEGSALVSWAKILPHTHQACEAAQNIQWYYDTLAFCGSEWGLLAGAPKRTLAFHKSPERQPRSKGSDDSLGQEANQKLSNFHGLTADEVATPHSLWGSETYVWLPTQHILQCIQI